MTLDAIVVAVATILAIILGPIIAVWITRRIDDQRADKARKFDIFRTLMRTRRLPIHIEHVAALNLVEVEFVDHQAVVGAWKNYLAHLSERLPPIEEKARFDAAVKRGDSLLTKLIYEISKILKIKVEQLDILEANYVPQGWYDEDWEQRLARRGLINVLYGRSPVVIAPQSPSHSESPYPPPPASE